MTYSLAGGVLGTNGDYVEVIAWGTCGATANNKQIKLYFGATAIMTSTNSPANTVDWNIHAIIARSAATTQDTTANFMATSTFTNQNIRTTPAETLSGAVTIKCTGTATADNDIVQ